jgi:hypothetical protein
MVVDKMKDPAQQDERKLYWESGWSCWLTFVEEFGFIDVAIQQDIQQDISALCRWVKQQRENYKLLLEGNQSELDKEKIDQMTAKGFQWTDDELSPNPTASHDDEEESKDSPSTKPGPTEKSSDHNQDAREKQSPSPGKEQTTESSDINGKEGSTEKESPSDSMKEPTIVANSNNEKESNVGDATITVSGHESRDSDPTANMDESRPTYEGSSPTEDVDGESKPAENNDEDSKPASQTAKRRKQTGNDWIGKKSSRAKNGGTENDPAENDVPSPEIERKIERMSQTVLDSAAAFPCEADNSDNSESDDEEWTERDSKLRARTPKAKATPVIEKNAKTPAAAAATPPESGGS